MNHDKIIESFTSTEGCCKTQHCVHKKGMVCNGDDDFNTRFCLNCISGIFHASLDEIERKRQEKRGKISAGHQFFSNTSTSILVRHFFTNKNPAMMQSYKKQV